jgi:hypothetical protein
MGRLRGSKAETGTVPDEWTRVAFARHQPEADMLIGMLHNEGLTAYARRPAGADVPDMGAGGPREIMVRAIDALRAHALIDPMPSDDTDGSHA